MKQVQVINRQCMLRQTLGRNDSGNSLGRGRRLCRHQGRRKNDHRFQSGCSRVGHRGKGRPMVNKLRVWTCFSSHVLVVVCRFPKGEVVSGYLAWTVVDKIVRSSVISALRRLSSRPARTLETAVESIREFSNLFPPLRPQLRAGVSNVETKCVQLLSHVSILLILSQILSC